MVGCGVVVSCGDTEDAYGEVEFIMRRRIK